MRLLLLSVLLLTSCQTVDKVITNEEEAYSYQIQADQELKEQTIQQFNWLGMLLLTSGVVLVAFTSRKVSGLILATAGAGLMSSLWVLDSSWFPWVAGSVVTIALADGLYILIKRSIKFAEDKEQPK